MENAVGHLKKKPTKAFIKNWTNALLWQFLFI